jgi:hypothetical protein
VAWVALRGVWSQNRHLLWLSLARWRDKFGQRMIRTDQYRFSEKIMLEQR